MTITPARLWEQLNKQSSWLKPDSSLYATWKAPNCSENGNNPKLLLVQVSNAAGLSKNAEGRV
jgi:hypothetical protein